MKDLSIYTNDFINYCKLHKGLSAKTLRAYSIDLNQLWAQTHGDLSKASICRYISHLHKSYKPRTCRRKIAVIKAFVHFLLIDDIIDSNPFDKIDASFREPSLLPRTIPLSIINGILKAAYNERKLAKTAYSDKMCLRDIAILEMLFATGARVSEMCSLTPDDIDLESHSVRIFGKGSKERIVQIENTDVLEILREYSSAFSSDITFSGYFFVNRLHRRLSEQSVREIINKYALLCRGDIHITPHMFRHSFATLLLEEDVDIRYIQRLLGHSSITTTQIYTHVAMSKQREILSAKHPRNKIDI